ncbi:MAG TPA: NAD(P)-dependent oxidoreductase [Membranihabitans sp.]|nr:NAD(P)-dependent oxidoreductase [Membranihabitans sp.]
MERKSIFPDVQTQNNKKLIVVTGSSGRIGFSLIKNLSSDYRLVGLDLKGPPYPPTEAECISFDITDKRAIGQAMKRIRYGYGNDITSVIHLAAFYSFNTMDSPLYEKVNEEGSRMFLEHLHQFNVEQFIYVSTNLIYKPQEPGQKIDENSPVEVNWGYPESKLHTEKLIRSYNRDIPTVFLRLGGVYTDWCHSIPISQQIKRIYENDLISHFFSGDIHHGSVFVHMEDVIDAIVRTVDRRHDIPNEMAINIGEPETPTYQELQNTIGQLIHDKEWATYEMPKGVAKVGSWLRELWGDPFIKPWMIDRADEHYEYDISRAQEVLGWYPKHRLLDTLPVMIQNLKSEPQKWYEVNNLDR